VKTACIALGLSRATVYRKRRPPILGPPAPRGPKTPPAWTLTETEQAEVLDLLHSERFEDASVAQVWATLIDEGVYICSMRTMYRILKDAGEDGGDRRRHAVHRARVRPELVAETPNVVWSWDIERHEAS